MSDQTPLDAETIRARLDATSPSIRVDVQVGGSTLRATANANDRPGFVGAVGGLVGAVTGGDLGPTTVTFADDEDGQDATFALNAANDIRSLLDENARLNAENARYLRIINEITRDNAGLTSCLDAVQAEAHKMLAEHGQSWNSISGRRILNVFDAAPEMPHPPAEEAQERPETARAGSGRGTGVAEAPGTAQVDDDV